MKILLLLTSHTPAGNNNNKVYFIIIDILQVITNRQAIHQKYLTYLTEDMRKIIIQKVTLKSNR